MSDNTESLRLLFDLYVDAVGQGTYYCPAGEKVQRYGHSFTSTWEDAFKYFRLTAPDVDESEFKAAVEAKRIRRGTTP